MRAVANLVRGENVESALAQLNLMPKKAAKLISKALVSATANATDRGGDDVAVEELYIQTIAVDGGKILRGWMPRAMGRWSRINHRTSHLTVVVSDEPKGKQ
jgi:large subunit ribosomal protein L22